MNKICLILPYFGNLPSMFPFFLQSCCFNNHIDFLIFTNPSNKESLCLSNDNIRLFYIEWSDFVKKIQSKFDFPISLNSPYKLCDYKPAYGYLFQEYLSVYDYWGHCDCDLIWGDLSVLNNYIEKGYDRIGEYGHLILYKNTDEVNSWFKTLTAAGVPSYKEIYSSDINFSFDEFAGMNILVQANHKNTFSNRMFDDIIFYKKNFWSRREFDGNDTKWDSVFFKYEEGKLYRYVWRNGGWKYDESLYVHFQKRKLTIETTETSLFIIIPNRIIKMSQYTELELKRLCRAKICDMGYWTMLLKSKLKKICRF